MQAKHVPSKLRQLAERKVRTVTPVKKNLTLHLTQTWHTAYCEPENKIFINRQKHRRAQNCSCNPIISGELN